MEWTQQVVRACATIRIKEETVNLGGGMGGVWGARAGRELCRYGVHVCKPKFSKKEMNMNQAKPPTTLPGTMEHPCDPSTWDIRGLRSASAAQVSLRLTWTTGDLISKIKNKSLSFNIFLCVFPICNHPNPFSVLEQAILRWVIYNGLKCLAHGSRGWEACKFDAGIVG